MSLPVVFRRAARTEFDDAADWYEQRRAGLGTTFTAAVQQTLDHIANHPDFYPQVHHDVREALVSGYPYCVYYRQESTQVVILSVFHTSRDPSIWQGRGKGSRRFRLDGREQKTGLGCSFAGIF